MPFSNLTNQELQAVTELCTERQLGRGDILAKQGSDGDEFYILTKGFVEISIESQDRPKQTVVRLGKGQLIGEMALIDQGPRSATVIALSDPTIVQVIQRDRFERLCEENTKIGYNVMKEIAAELSFKLRHRNWAFD